MNFCMSSIFSLLLPFGFQARAAFLALCEEFLVAAGVNVYLAVCKLGHGGDHLVEVKRRSCETAMMVPRKSRSQG